MGATADYLNDLFIKHKAAELEFNGECHDCHGKVSIVVKDTVEGGLIYKIVGIDKPFLKCQECGDKDSILRNYQPCEVYARVVGYLAPLKRYNKGKKEEFKFRKEFVVASENLDILPLQVGVVDRTQKSCNRW